MPDSRREYWVPKLIRNRTRDAANVQALQAAGWQKLIIWECEMQDIARLENRLRVFLK